jgi:hypothetical protein
MRDDAYSRVKQLIQTEPIPLEDLIDRLEDVEELPEVVEHMMAKWEAGVDKDGRLYWRGDKEC